jgi:hypothetical protein
MDSNKDIDTKVEALLSHSVAEKEVPISPFFKDKTLDILFAEKEERTVVSGWFTPKLQLAALVLILLANSYVLYTMNQSNYNQQLDEFAETYQLSIDSEISTYLE